MFSAKPITRANPSCFVFLIDQSGSMKDPFADGSGTRSKAHELADGINRMLLTLVNRCTIGEEVLHRFDIAVLGYSGDTVASALGGDLKHADLVPISELGRKPLRFDERMRKVEDGVGGTVRESFNLPIWLEPVHSGGTPMCKALAKCESLLAGWTVSHPQSYPPTVMHVTDGESTDGDPLPGATAIKALSTNAGGVALFNLHLSSEQGESLVFPDSSSRLANSFATTLFEMSSILPERLRMEAANEGYRVTSNSRAFAFNADLVDSLSFLDIGTRTDVAR